MQGQHLMQQMNQSLMGGYASPTSVTTDLIQQYLDENKQLILAILDNQNSGKVEECARNQAKLQHNLMYLAAIADSQPPQAASIAQYPPNMMMQSGGSRYMQAQPSPLVGQAAPQSLMSARNPMLYGQTGSSLSPLSGQAAGMNAGLTPGPSGGFNLLHGDSSMGPSGGGLLGSGMFADFTRGGTSSAGHGKHEIGSDGKSGDGTDPMYLKGNEDES
ncbi:GRF1-interacting factor 1 [Rhynchospora pubera]|uniref:SS18 N-terminal domain-containing protein n=2 Tax=Rhynchospora TaxID=46332 RepID=A0A9Q0HVK4_9POAL|nr:hypothetical protein LUZ63_008007 [Rhynchospora breviuscula]KAJ4753474.1 GRF1-interacting factor 1 [Rhynchospora pubera]KAJ4764649.1 GRF1-interacting factor 1 [Rhynchospora pubera]KAJ4817355.1 GRF1-interacting factor 1 [Rhynchospora pubera]